MATTVTEGRAVGPVSASKGAKVAERLQKRIESGEYYEALQTYKALYQRYRAQNREKEALDLLYDGAATLLRHGQWECGNDLAIMLVTHYKENQIPISDISLNRINTLFSLYQLSSPSKAGVDSINLRLNDLAMIDPREIFMRAALKWSHMVGDKETCKYGHPALHQLLATQYKKEKQFPLAADHYLYADAPQEFVDMLIEFATSYGLPWERDLFLARACLQLLVLKKPQLALQLYRLYLGNHPDLSCKEGDPPFNGEPTLNFVWFLVSSASNPRSVSTDCFHWIKRNYGKVIEMDPSFSEYVEKIGVLYFGVAATMSAEGDGVGAGPGGLMELLGGAGGDGLLGTLLGSLSQPSMDNTSTALVHGMPLSSEGERMSVDGPTRTGFSQPMARLDDDDVLD